MVTVIIADDHPGARLGARLALEKTGDMQVVASVDSPAALFHALKNASCDIVLADFAMPDRPGADGFAMLEHLRTSHPSVPVVVLTTHLHGATVRAIEQAGCAGICDKARPLAELVHAVRACAAGRHFRCASADQAMGSAGIEDMHPPVTLTLRETEVVRLHSQGFTGTEIASLLGRSRKTVSRHKRSAMARLQITTDRALAEYATRHGLA